MSTTDREPKTFGYGRASTKKQEASPESQKASIRDYTNFNKLGDVTFFSDAATSGKIAWQERDAGKEVFRQLRQGDHVILTIDGQESNVSGIGSSEAWNMLRRNA